MNKTKTLIGIIVLIILLGGGFFILGKSDADPITSNEVSKSPSAADQLKETESLNGEIDSPEIPDEKPNTFTLSEISNHKTESDCWSAISNKVYDFTPWINEHPGGAKAILGICGIDGTSAYSEHHGGDKEAEEKLENFIIGDLI